MNVRLLVLGLLAVCGLTSPASAAYVSVSSRSTLAGTDFLDWGSAGAEGATPTNPFTITSNGGKSVTVSQATGTFLRQNQGSLYGGLFANGDKLLVTNQTANRGPITINFGTAVSAAGAQFQTNFFGTFTATVEALNSAGTSLFTYTFTGNAGSGGGNSAVFAGISTNAGSTFTQLRFTGISGVTNPNAFAINQLDFTPAAAPPPPTNAVPAPPGLMMVLSGAAFAGVTALIRRRRTVVA